MKPPLFGDDTISFCLLLFFFSLSSFSSLGASIFPSIYIPIHFFNIVYLCFSFCIPLSLSFLSFSLSFYPSTSMFFSISLNVYLSFSPFLTFSFSFISQLVHTLLLIIPLSLPISLPLQLPLQLPLPLPLLQ